MRAGGSPDSESASSSASFSPTDSEFASELVPNTASPTPWSSSHRQWRTQRTLSGRSSESKGVTTGDNTPRMRAGWLNWEAPALAMGASYTNAPAYGAGAPSPGDRNLSHLAKSL